MEAKGVEIAHLEQGEPGLSTPSHIVSAAIDGIGAGYTRYVPAAGLPELRQAVARKLSKQYGFPVEMAEVVTTNGATMGLYLAFVAILQEGDEVLVIDPAFGQFRRIAELVGARVVPVETVQEEGRFGVSGDRIREKLSDHAKLIVVNSPNNPTGTVYTDRELLTVAEVALEHDLFVVSDEVYDKIVFGDNVHRSIVEVCPDVRSRTIVINSFSKTYAMTGWRLGYNFSTKKLATRMADISHSSLRCATAFVQWAGIQALQGPQSCVAEAQALYTHRRDVMAEELGAISSAQFSRPEGTFYFFVDFSSTGMGSSELAMTLIQEGRVAVAPGDYFGTVGENCIRLCFAGAEESIRVGVRRLGKVVDSLANGSARKLRGH
jgi:aspartate aminotransferase